MSNVEKKPSPADERDELIRLMGDVLNWTKDSEQDNGWWKEMHAAIEGGHYPFGNAPNLGLVRRKIPRQ